MGIKFSKRIPVRFARHMSDEEIRSEQEVVQGAMREAEKFGILYDRYFEDIFYFILRRTDDEELTADLTSQTFYNALNKLKKYQFKGLPFSAWLFRIATNEVNKHYRNKNLKRVFSLEEERVKEIMEEAGEEGTEEKINHLVRKLNELPTDVVELLELRFFEDRNFKEIAFILEISESSAKMRVYRTLERLRQDMIKEGIIR